MRPGRSDIAAPDLPPSVPWVGDPPNSMPQLTATGPVLVHFFDFAQLNSVRTAPYVREWHRRYGSLGLSVLGVQAPRFPFGADPEVVGAGIDRLEISYPVAIDADREMWFDYGCEGWPSLFLWGRDGALAWYHFGEGEYVATEEAIQEELRSGDALRDLPGPMEPLRATDIPGAAVMPPTPELFPAGEGEPLAVDERSQGVEVGYAAGGAFATIEGRGKIRVTIDGESTQEVEVAEARLYELAIHPRHEAHRLRLEFAAGEMSLWSVSFAPGVP